MNALRAIVGVLAAISLCLPLHALRPAAAEEAEELADLKQRIRQGRAALDRVRRGESSVLEVLEEIETTLQRKRRRLETLNSRLRQRPRGGQAELAARQMASPFSKRAGTPWRAGSGPSQWERGNPFRAAQR